MASNATPTNDDPTAPAFWRRADRHEVLAEIRAATRSDPEAGLTTFRGERLHLVLDHPGVHEASIANDRFCSGDGILLNDVGQDIPKFPGALLYFDPPDHTRYRKLVAPGFSPARMAAAQPMVRRLAIEALDDLVVAAKGDRAVDVVATATVPFPLRVIAETLGVPPEDWPRFHVWSDAMIAAATEVTEETLVQQAEFAGYLAEHIDARRASPADDLISFLATVEVDGEQLNNAELMMFLFQLLVAGNETTRNLLSASLVALADAPDQWAVLTEVAADPASLAIAVEELLRFTSPVISFLRTATVDSMLGNRRVLAGDRLLLVYSSANRDPEVFGPDAEALDLRRHPNPHLAFGFGGHFCLGAALARREGRIFFEEFVARVASLEQAPDRPATWAESTVIAGVAAAPMRLTLTEPYADG